MSSQNISQNKFETSSEGKRAIKQRLSYIASTIKPPPLLTVSQWAEEFRYLSPESSAEPGKWKNKRTPYLVDIMNILSPFSGHQEIVMDFASQTGKTEVLNNFVGYVIDQDPGPILIIQENIKPMAETWSKDRLDPMLRDTLCLKGKVSEKKSRDSQNTILHKKYKGGHITIVGANSPGSLASRPIRYLLADEIDRYKPSAGKEGNPLNLAKKRTVTFWNKKILYISSPSYKDIGIDALYEKSDQRKYHVPCPKCKKLQVLKWSSIRWPKKKPKEVIYKCEFCNFDIPQHKKYWMLARGEWRIKYPGEGRLAGFWLSQLYSPFISYLGKKQLRNF